MRLPRFSVPALPQLLTAIVVLFATVFTLIQLRPDLLLANTTTAGGDMGAHVWLPTYVRDHLLPHGRLTGWSPDWYNGFPALHFYFPLPTIMILLLDLIMPTNVAFKLVSVSGVVALPFCAYLFGRLARLPFPVPACLAAGTLPFLFDTGFTIFGGNIASTLAGEFAFSIALSLAMVFLGVVANGLHSNKRKALAALLFGLVVMSHILPTIFAFVGGCLLLLMRFITGKRAAPRSATIDGLDDPYVTDEAKAEHEQLVHQIEEQLDANSTVMTDTRADTPAGTTAVSGPDAGKPKKSGLGAVLRERWIPLRWSILVVVVGAMLASWWLVPFVLRMGYMNDMGWEKMQPLRDSSGQLVASAVELYGEKIYTYADALFPNAMLSIVVLATVGALLSLIFRRRIGIFFTVLTAIWGAAYVLAPQGRLWNARFLPFWFFCLYMLAALAIAEFGWGIADGVRALRKRAGGYSRDIAEGMALVSPVVALAAAFLWVASSLVAPNWWKVPLHIWHTSESTDQASFIPGWAQWNYSGYERKEAYPEFQALVQKMDEIGRTNGCGRALWEYESELNRFGTPMALMRLPTLTKGCIGSEEGLYFESSASVPYHFMNQSELSAVPSRAMRGLPYEELDIAGGVDKLQMMGVKYYMTFSQTAQQEAQSEPRLSLLASVPAASTSDGQERSWQIYEVAGSAMVSPLTNLPVVMSDEESQPRIASDAENEGERAKRSESDIWLDNSTTWFQDSSKHDVVLAADGPKNWPRVKNASDEPQRVAVDPVTVSNISQSDDRITFDVDKVGVPVLVKMSYFPNWQVSGAEKVYRVTPNSMVVVPTKNTVSLRYGRTPVDYLGLGLTLTGIGGLAWLAWSARRRGEENGGENGEGQANAQLRATS